MDIDVTQHPLYKQLVFAIDHYPQRLTCFAIEKMLMETARSNDKRPAYIKFYTLDGIVKNLDGKDNLRDSYLFIRIPRDVVDRSKSPIILPGEADGAAV